MTKSDGKRVLLDTNVLVSGLVYRGGKPHELLLIAEEEGITLIVPEQVLDELNEVFTRKFSEYRVLLDRFLDVVSWQKVEKERLQQWMETAAEHVRDKKDAFMLATALECKPDFVVTGDRILREDMKAVDQLSPHTVIATASEVLRKLRRD